MLTIGAVARIYLATGVTDLRKGHNTLYAHIQAQWAGRDPLNGDLFVFCNRRQDALKIFFWNEGTMWVCAGRLERGTYRWPAVGSGPVTMTATELQLLLSGIDLAGSRRRVRWQKAEISA